MEDPTVKKRPSQKGKKEKQRDTKKKPRKGDTPDADHTPLGHSDGDDDDDEGDDGSFGLEGMDDIFGANTDSGEPAKKPATRQLGFL